MSNENISGHPEREPRSNALIPFIVFIIFYVGLSIWEKNFYCVPMPVAFIVASATALLLDHKLKLMDKVELYAQGMGDSNIMIMCMIFILAGAFAATAKAMGAVDAAVLISRHLVPDHLILVGFFLVSCFISLAIGTSCGTIAALTPIAIGLVSSMDISSTVMLGAVVGGAMFGDNMSMISDTTIAATRTQNVAMRDKFLMNLKMIFPAAIIAIILYWLAGKTGASVSDLPPIKWQDILAILPYVMILLGALIGLNVMALLFLGTLISIITGMIMGSFTFMQSLAKVGEGTLSMSETLIVAILAGGLLRLIRHNGGITFLMNWIEQHIFGARGCEFGVVLLVSAINLFTANNTVAIVVVGPIARQLSEKFHCDSRRIASILDSASCVIQGLIPYGAQILIAIGLAKEAGVFISSMQLIGAMYYPMFLGIVLIISIAVPGIFNFKKNA